MSATARVVPGRRLFEFLAPFPMHIVDQEEWPPITVAFNDISLSVLKPTTVQANSGALGTLGNESADSYCTIFRVLSGLETAPESMTGISNVIDNLLLWIRVRARHYWLLHGSRGYGSFSRGSIIDRQRQLNFVLAGSYVLVRPFSRTMWLSLEQDLRSQSTPPISESLFCDGLLSAVARDEMKALLELGVACEIEITQLLDAVATASPITSEKQTYLSKKGDRDRFAVKLNDWTSRLGLDNIATFQPADVPPNWLPLVEGLYNMRNGVAHSGRKKPGGATVQTYMFAANALFRYSHLQKRRLSLLQYDFDAADDPTKQIVAYSDAVLHFVAE